MAPEVNIYGPKSKLSNTKIKKIVRFGLSRLLSFQERKNIVIGLHFKKIPNNKHKVVLGYCHITKFPNIFAIEINELIEDPLLITSVIFHELVHIKQRVKGEVTGFQRWRWRGRKMKKGALPMYEKNALRLEKRLMNEWLTQ